MITQHQHTSRELSAGGEETIDGRKVMRMPQRPGSTSRKTQTPSEVISNLWEGATDKMRNDWLALYGAILSSGGEHTAEQCAAMADEAYFEFHARCNPSKFDTSAG